MKKIFYFLFAFCLACGNAGDGESRQDLRESGQAFAKFNLLFNKIDTGADDVLDCSTMTYGTHVASPYSNAVIPNKIMEKAIDDILLREAHYDANQKHYALASFNFDDSKKAYLVGAYTDDQSYSSHLFLYDKDQKQFINTQSLNFVFGGGEFLSVRKAWLTDVNDDDKLDIVYRRDEMSADEEHTIYVDTLYAEVWNENHFIEYALEDTESMKETFTVSEYY